MRHRAALAYDLRTCLHAQAYRSLLTIARFHGWPFDTSRAKKQVIADLVQRLTAPDQPTTMLEDLNTTARAALRALLTAGGQLPQADFIAFLSYLNRIKVRPIHGRWLAPKHFRALVPFLMPYDAAAARSELQFSYLTFLHYLAERGELLAVCAGRLRPTQQTLGFPQPGTADWRPQARGAALSAFPSPPPRGAWLPGRSSNAWE